MPADYCDYLIRFLVGYRFPFYEDHASQGEVLLGAAARLDLTSTRGDIIAYAAELRGKPRDELESMAAEARATVCQLAMHERELNHRFPNYDSEFIAADFDFWSKFPTWTPAEAAALALGADPYKCHYEKLLALADTMPFAEKYCRLFDLVERATLDRILSPRTTPLQFLAWAEGRLDLPQELVAAVKRARADQQPPSATCDGRPEYLDELGDTRIRISTVAKLVWGMVKAHYEHHPEKQRNSTVPRIVSDCLTQGHSVDQKTVRRALAFLAEYCQPD
jgi:hypothetical protein